MRHRWKASPLTQVAARQAAAGTVCVSTQAPVSRAPVPVALQRGEGGGGGGAEGHFAATLNKAASLSRLHMQQYACPSCQIGQAAQSYPVYLD